MLRFCGFELELFVDEVLARENGPTVCCGRDFAGGLWLIVQVDDDPDRLVWMCAPASGPAIQAVRGDTPRQPMCSDTAPPAWWNW